MIKKRFFVFIGIAILTLPALTQIKTLKTSRSLILTKRPLTLARSKIKVEGFASYYGNAKYISVYIKLMYKGKNLSTPVVRLNNSVITNRGKGEYRGALTPYNSISVGNRLVFTAEFPKSRFHELSEESLLHGKIVLATYRISNIIEWVYPKKHQTINVLNILTVPFRWNFTGTPKTTEFFLKDKSTNTRIFSKNIRSEFQKVNASLFRPGREYVMGMWAVDPLGKFKISRECDSLSKVVFYFSDTMTFKTDTGIRILNPRMRKF